MTTIAEPGSMMVISVIDGALNGAPALSQLLRTWSAPVVPMGGLSLGLILYLRGFVMARVTRAQELPPWRAVCFVCGVVSLWIALASPIDALDDYLLSAHMLQHFILMSIAPPLIVLGAPVVPMLRGLPRFVIRGLRPVFQARWVYAAAWAITHPVFAWMAMNVAYLGWHVPAMFEMTFRSERIHEFEHICFFMSSLLFWLVVISPRPARARWPRWAMIPYLLSADVLNTVLSATLAFAGKVLYSSYAEAPRVCSLTPLKDQVAAGAEMWVLNSVVMLIPVVVIAMRELSPRFVVRSGDRALEQRAEG